MKNKRVLLFLMTSVSMAASPILAGDPFGGTKAPSLIGPKNNKPKIPVTGENQKENNPATKTNDEVKTPEDKKEEKGLSKTTLGVAVVLAGFIIYYFFKPKKDGSNKGNTQYSNPYDPD